MVIVAIQTYAIVKNGPEQSIYFIVYKLFIINKTFKMQEEKRKEREKKEKKGKTRGGGGREEKEKGRERNWRGY